MSIGKALRRRMDDTAGVTSLVGRRIYPGQLEQGATYPAIRYHVVSAERTHLMGADSGDVHALVQVDCYDETYDGAKTLADAVRAALSRWSGTAASVVVEAIFLRDERDVNEPSLMRSGEPGIFRIMLEFMCHYAE